MRVAYELAQPSGADMWDDPVPSRSGWDRVTNLFLVSVLVVTAWYAGGGVWQLWLSDWYTAYHQSQLIPEPVPMVKLASTAPVPTFAAGDPVGRIVVPVIGMDWVFVAGKDLSTLRKGPGWWVESSYPGRSGNVVISGHRTTYGAPFRYLVRLNSGDQIMLSTSVSGEVTYEVVDVFAVRPDELWVADQLDGSWLTLTTCHPEGSATERLVVRARLVP